MNLTELLARVCDETGYGAPPSSGPIRTRFVQFLNDGVRRVLSEEGMGRLLDSDDPYTFASVAQQARYVVPESVQAILTVTERTNNRSLEAMSLDVYRRINPNPTTYAAVPVKWVPIGKVAVAVQPTAADQLWVKSTSASDGASVTAYVQGIRTGGYLATDSVALNGTTAVQVPAFTDWIELTSVYLSASAVGTVTVLQTSGAGAELARISIGHKRPTYFGFYLWPTPNATITYYVDYRRMYEPMSTNTDDPPFPTDFHPLLVDYAVWREFSLKNDPRKADALQRYGDWLKRLKFATQWAADEVPVMGNARTVGYSRLGGMFPPDIWTRG